MKKFLLGLAAALFGVGIAASPTKASIADDISWENVPDHWEYNWNNESSCWNWGMWKDGVCYKSEEPTFNNDVRHNIKITVHDNCIYMKITYATVYESKANGNDFIFYIDGQIIGYDITFPNNKTIVQEEEVLDSGEYPCSVHYQNNFTLVEGAEAVLCVPNRDDGNYSLVLKIPLLNGDLGDIKFFCHNLTYRTIDIAGASTGIKIFLPTILLLTLICISKKEKKNGTIY